MALQEKLRGQPHLSIHILLQWVHMRHQFLISTDRVTRCEHAQLQGTNTESATEALPGV
jgi:hypothetical protein